MRRKCQSGHLFALCFGLFLLSCPCIYANTIRPDLLKEFPSAFYQPESAMTLYLNGVGLSSPFSRDAYLGAIYLTSPTTSVTQVLENRTPKRMSLYFIRERPNIRDFLMIWLETICQNQRGCRTIEDDLQELRRLFYKSEPEDRVFHLDYLPEQNKLNVISGDKMLGSVQNGRIFCFLLQSWLGNYPPSKKFKEGILAGIPGPLNTKGF